MNASFGAIRTVTSHCRNEIRIVLGLARRINARRVAVNGYRHGIRDLLHGISYLHGRNTVVAGKASAMGEDAAGLEHEPTESSGTPTSSPDRCCCRPECRRSRRVRSGRAEGRCAMARSQSRGWSKCRRASLPAAPRLYALPPKGLRPRRCAARSASVRVGHCACGRHACEPPFSPYIPRPGRHR